MPALAHFFLLTGLLLSGSSASGDSSVLSSELGRLNNQSLLWGPYKSNLYLGIRPRLPRSLWTTLMWGSVDSFDKVGESMWLSLPPAREQLLAFVVEAALRQTPPQGPSSHY